MERPDLIAALATPAGRGAIGILRLSGPNLRSIFPHLLERVPAPREAVLTRFLDASGEAIDTGLALYFQAPHSYTGEDVLELHGHGGQATLSQLLRRCGELGARLAEPGEFTRRAFLNDKLDLAQAEAVADLIDAASEAAARCALRSLQGEFSREINHLLNALIELRARVEASIDFPDEGLESLQAVEMQSELQRLLSQLQRIRQAAHAGSVLREGAVVVLVGGPNVGKSSLLNRLAAEEAAIVTPYPGTTRDVIRRLVAVDGVPIHLLDTAGLHASEDPVEQIGISRARNALEQAELALVVRDITAPNESDAAWEALPEKLPRIVVENKIDLASMAPLVYTEDGTSVVRVSALTGAGMAELKAEILRMIGFNPGEEGLFLARERHLLALDQAQQHVIAARAQVAHFELFAEDLRQAQCALGEIVGEYSSDDLLGQIFSRFCIGK